MQNTPNILAPWMIVKTTGYLDRRDGVTEQSGGYGYTDFIPIAEGERLVMNNQYTGSGTSTCAVLCYDSGKQFVSALLGNSVPEGTESIKFVRFNLGNPALFEDGGSLEGQDYAIYRRTTLPPVYSPYGYVLKDRVVTPEKLSVSRIYREGYDTYEGDIAELYVYPAGYTGITNIVFRYYDGNLILRGRNDSTSVWTSSLTASGKTNGKPYELKCTTAGGGFALNDICGYVVFKDISHFTDNSVSTDSQLIDMARAGCLFLQPNIETLLTSGSFPDNGITAAKISSGAVSETKIADSAVSTAKISNNAVTPTKISQGAVYKATTRYTDDVAELFLTGKAIKDVAKICLRNSSSSTPKLILRALTSNTTTIWSCEYTGISLWQNGKVYELKCTTAGGELSVGDICGYVIFKDIAHFLTTSTGGQTDLIDIPRSQLLYLQPYIEGYLTTQVSSESIVDGSLSIAKLADDAKAEMVANGLEIVVPDVLPVVINNTIRVYWRSIIKTPNPYIYDVYAVSSVGKSYPRYYEVTPTAIGNYTVTIYVKNSAGLVIAQKAFTLRCVAAMSSPASNINILTIGASATASGYIAGELKRRLTTSDGAGTPQSPTGLGLSNIAFVGRKTGSVITTVNQEATGGWGWDDFATIGRTAFRFVVTGVNVLSIGATYRDSNSRYAFTIKEINVTDGAGNIRCTFEGSGELASSGTLTKLSGDGDATITFTSQETEGGNPFWNVSDGELDFTSYANSYCNGDIGLIVSHCGMNDIQQYTIATIGDLFTNYVKPFVRAFHAEFPNAKFVFSTLPLGSVNGGMGSSYGANSFWNYYNIVKRLFALSQAAHAMEAETEFSGYFSVADVVPSFDCENLYPTKNSVVALRLTTNEVLQSNGVHPIEQGSYTVSDAIYHHINWILGS